MPPLELVTGATWQQPHYFSPRLGYAGVPGHQVPADEGLTVVMASPSDSQEPPRSAASPSDFTEKLVGTFVLSSCHSAIRPMTGILLVTAPPPSTSRAPDATLLDLRLLGPYTCAFILLQQSGVHGKHKAMIHLEWHQTRACSFISPGWGQTERLVSLRRAAREL